MTDVKQHFWFSGKQRNMIIRIALDLGQLPATRRCKLDTGEVREFTTQTENNKPTSLWDDLEYLGTGCINSITYGS